MPGADHHSLRRSEAVSRAQLITVRATAVTLDLTSDEEFRSTTEISFDATAGSSTFLDFRGRELVAVVLNERRLDPASCQAGRIPLSDLAEHNRVVVEGVMEYSSDGEGLHRHVDPADGLTYLYAMSFLDAAPRWFACFDQPDLKSPYHFTITAPPEWTVIGNGPSVQGRPGHWTIDIPLPLSSYFVTLVAGPYASVYGEHDGVRLGCHVRASLGPFLRNEAADILEVTRASLDYYHRTFEVRYPFGEYHQAFVPDFNAGAMENPGCVTLRDDFIYRARATRAERASRAGVIAHEMAHMWFGDLVTMRWWDDLWLNESFAEYMAHRCCTDATKYQLWTEFGIVRKDWGAVADQSPSTHPVAGNAAEDAASALANFDGISYAKGAAVLRQLVGYLGDGVFRSGLRDHFARHTYGNADFADLVAALTRAGGQDLDRWTEAWLRTSGMDILQVSHEPDHHPAVLRVPPAGQHSDRVHAVQVAGYRADGTELIRAPLLVAADPVPVPVPAAELALLVPDAGDESWARVRFGPDGWRQLPAVLHRRSDPAVRVVLVNAVRDAVRSAELDPAAALGILCDAALVEPDEVVVTPVLRFAEDQLAGPYCPPGQHARRLARVHAAATAILTAAEAGSDRALAAFRLAIHTAGDVDLLSHWLTGEDLPAGLALDPELRWALVERTSALTGDADLIEATLAADPSASARVHAARARAALPLPEAKEAAWSLLVEPSAAAAYELYATAEGFFRPWSRHLTGPYVARYFTELPPTAQFRSGWVLGRVAALAYPATEATVDTLALADQALSRSDLAPPVRRAIVDGTDRLRRAVASLRTFGAGG